MTDLSFVNFRYDEETQQQFNLTALAAVLSEWHLIVSDLPKDWQRRLRPPQLSLNPTMAAWGCWHGGEKRLLEIKSSLLENRPWQAMLEVLRHEIAHQIVEECFPEVQEPAHGPKFRAVCRVFGANPAASGSYPTLEQRIFADENDSLSEEARLLNKVRKLLALSESTNEHEAQQALLKARTLTGKYSLTLPEDGEQTEEYFALDVGKPFPRRESHLLQLSSILQEFYQVAVVWLPIIDLLTGKNHFSLVVHGTRGKVKIASYVFDCLMQQIDKSWQQLPWEVKWRNSGVRGKKEFASGLLRGFREALQKQNNAPEMQALVHLELAQQARLNEYLHRLYSRLQKFSSQKKSYDKTLQAAGHAEGKKLVLPPGLNRQDSAPKKLR